MSGGGGGGDGEGGGVMWLMWVSVGVQRGYCLLIFCI